MSKRIHDRPEDTPCNDVYFVITRPDLRGGDCRVVCDQYGAEVHASTSPELLEYMPLGYIEADDLVEILNDAFRAGVEFAAKHRIRMAEGDE